MIARAMAAPRDVAVVVALRVLAAITCFVAAVIMVTSHEKTTFFTIRIEAKFQDTPAFKFLVGVNAVVCGYSLIILFVPLKLLRSRLILAMDLLLAMLLTGCLAAAGAIGYIGKKGSMQAGWLPVCDQIPKFCHQTMGAVICNFVGLLLYTFIVLIGIMSPLYD